MQIDITDFFNTACARDYSASIAEIGRDAGADTWRAACDDAPDYPMLDTAEKREAFKAYISTWGAWNDAEIEAMNLDALFLQSIAGDMRDAGLDVRPVDWAAYEARAEKGNIATSIYPGDDGRVYYYAGC